MAVDFSPNVAYFFVCNSVRIGQNFPNEVPDLSSPILLITILIAEMESLMGPRRIISVFPYGPKTSSLQKYESVFLVVHSRQQGA